MNIDYTSPLNFCNVFEFPDAFSSEFCFSGGIPTNFLMVDWFQPMCTADGYQTWDEVADGKLQKVILSKSYIKPDKAYLVITAFDEALIVRKQEDES